MANFLRFDGVNDHVTLPSAIPAMASDWQVEFKLIVKVSANTVIAGMADFTRFIEMRVPTNQIRVRGSANVSYDVTCPLTVGETCTIRVVSTVSPARLTVFKNGTQVGQVTFTQGLDGLIYIGRTGTSYGNIDLYYFRAWDAVTDRNYSANGITSGTVLPDINNPTNNGTLVGFTGTYWLDDTLATLPTSLTPNVLATGTYLSPFTSGAATLTFTGHSVPVTLAAGSFSFTIPDLVDDSTWIRLPTGADTFTLTQGATTFSMFRPINLPVNYDVLRDVSNNPANFENIVTDDPDYIGYYFAQASNPLTTSDTMYWDASSGLDFDRDGRPILPEDSAPITTTLKVHRASGKVYLHELALDEDGSIVGITNLYMGLGIRVGFGI